MDTSRDIWAALRQDAETIIRESLHEVLPDSAVRRALESHPFPGKVWVVAIGKAAWQMAKAAYESLGDQIVNGVVATKYGHVKGPLGPIACYEGGHPIPDQNSVVATQAALDMVKDLSAQDTVLFLISGGGSALFEKPLIPLDQLQDITQQLLYCGADIVEINTIRKRLSGVKGGRFAEACQPAQVYSIVLSDILGDPLDMIASGPAHPDASTCEQALKIVQKYRLTISDNVLQLLNTETPKKLSNTETQITGSVRALCSFAADACRKRGYQPIIITDYMDCIAREAGKMLAATAKTHARKGEKLAFIAGGETVVQLTGNGKGGRNQEIALAAALGLDGLPAAVFSIGSDGTDGPTDAAGGYVDGNTLTKLNMAGIDLFDTLLNNDAYSALKSVDGLIITGPTGTNVNDVAVALIGG